MLLLLSSCSIFFKSEGPKSALGKEYHLSFKDDAWNFKKNERSDYVYQNREDGRILLSNSFCEEFQEGTLKDLAVKTFKTVDKFKVLKEESLNFHEREAYRIHGQGIVDGVAVQVHLLNTRRNNCYFDFVAISPIAAITKSNADFEKFLSSVDFQ
jgi:hypothetical protein